MKTINPVTVWFNGEEQEATVIGATSNSDNLIDSASFTYQLFQETTYNPASGSGLIGLVSGYLTMTGEDYTQYDSNDYAYNWIAQKLNLTITGEYVPPTPPEPTPTPEPTPIVEETIA